jgi:hypothetical protein
MLPVMGDVGDVANKVTGGTQNAPVVQAGRIESLTFTAAPAVPAGSAEPAEPPAPDSGIQHNTAEDDARLFAVQNGDLHIHHHHGGPDSSEDPA